MNEFERDSIKQILIVDDHPVVRDGLAMIIEREDDLSVCAKAEAAPEALQAIEDTSPDVAVVDISLVGMSGLDLMKEIKKRNYGTVILALSMHEETLYAERAIRAGARGYVMKRTSTHEIVGAIRSVLKGKIFVSESMRERMMSGMIGDAAGTAACAVDTLSDRELEVFRLIGQGFKTGEIAEKLSVSKKTVETYRGRLKEKLNIQSAAELVRYAIEWTREHTSA